MDFREEYTSTFCIHFIPQCCMGKTLSKRWFSNESSLNEDTKYCLVLEGFPEVRDELPLNGFYEYIGDYNGFASCRGCSQNKIPNNYAIKHILLHNQLDISIN